MHSKTAITLVLSIHQTKEITMNILLYPHGGSGNHGCEAIVRATAKIMKGANLTLFSSSIEEDSKYGLGEVCTVQKEQQPISRFSFSYLKAFFRHRLFKDKDAFDRLIFRSIFSKAKKCRYALSIGGDNYCYGAPRFIYIINQQLRKQGIRTILWGCSVEPDAIQGEMLEDLKGYTHIFARESLTCQAMKEKGISQVSLFPDPAFQLNRVDLPLPQGFAEKNTVGINVSPLIIGYEQNQGITLQNYLALIQYLIDETDMQVALIPHVVWNHNDDRIPLKRLYETFKETGRVILLEDHNAEELKGYIARCRFMVAARTHASIADYSEQVPTLVVGYSVKARGIATDLFGTDEHYVIPVQALKQEQDLVKAFQWLYEHENEIRAHYQEVMPAYKAKVLEARGLLNQLSK